MPQRRAPFGYGISDGQTTGASPLSAMPLTGTGTNGAAYSTDFDQTPGAVPMESPATLRRRLMPIAGAVNREPDVFAAIQQWLAARKAGM